MSNDYITSDFLTALKIIISSIPFILYIEYNSTLIILFAITILFFILLIAILCLITGSFWMDIIEILIGMIWIYPSVIVCIIFGLENPKKLICICTMSWMSDGGGLLIGKVVGKNKLLESISPNKTIEGSIGAIGFSIATAYMFDYYSIYNFESIYRFNFTYNFNYVSVGIICSISAQIGDLIESKFKRIAGIKNSTMFMNPFQVFGGLMDRCDSIFVSLPMVYLLQFA